MDAAIADASPITTRIDGTDERVGDRGVATGLLSDPANQCANVHQSGARRAFRETAFETGELQSCRLAAVVRNRPV